MRLEIRFRDVGDNIVLNHNLIPIMRLENKSGDVIRRSGKRRSIQTESSGDLFDEIVCDDQLSDADVVFDRIIGDMQVDPARRRNLVFHEFLCFGFVRRGFVGLFELSI